MRVQWACCCANGVECAGSVSSTWPCGPASLPATSASSRRDGRKPAGTRCWYWPKRWAAATRAEPAARGGWIRPPLPQTPLAAEEMSHVRGVLQFILDRHEPLRRRRPRSLFQSAPRQRGARRHSSARSSSPTLLTDAPNSFASSFTRAAPAPPSSTGTTWRDHLLGRPDGSSNRCTTMRAGRNCWRSCAEYAGPLVGRRQRRRGRAICSCRCTSDADALDVRLFSTIMTLGTPRDVTLQELRVETISRPTPNRQPVSRRHTVTDAGPPFVPRRCPGARDATGVRATLDARSRTTARDHSRSVAIVLEGTLDYGRGMSFVE